MTCGSTYPCPLCYAKKGLLREIGDPRLWSEIISLCEQWMMEGGEREGTRKDFMCCHHMPTLGPSTATKVSNFVVPPPYTWSFSSMFSSRTSTTDGRAWLHE